MQQQQTAPPPHTHTHKHTHPIKHMQPISQPASLLLSRPERLLYSVPYEMKEDHLSIKFSNVPCFVLSVDSLTCLLTSRRAQSLSFLCLFAPCFKSFGTCEGTRDDTLNHTCERLSAAAEPVESMLRSNYKIQLRTSTVILGDNWMS